MNTLQTTLKSTPAFRSRPPEYFIASGKGRPTGSDADGIGNDSTITRGKWDKTRSDTNTFRSHDDPKGMLETYRKSFTHRKSEHHHRDKHGHDKFLDSEDHHHHNHQHSNHSHHSHHSHHSEHHHLHPHQDLAGEGVEEYLNSHQRHRHHHHSHHHHLHHQQSSNLDSHDSSHHHYHHHNHNGNLGSGTSSESRLHHSHHHHHQHSHSQYHHPASPAETETDQSKSRDQGSQNDDKYLRAAGDGRTEPQNNFSKLPYTKTIQQFQNYMSHMGVEREDGNLQGRLSIDGAKLSDALFMTKRLVTVYGERMLTSLKSVCQKLEILAVLPQIMSRLAIGDDELEDILGPECTDAILQLLYIQMAWLEYRCPQPDSNPLQGKTLHQIKRRLQKGVRAKMTKLKFPNALSAERMSLGKSREGTAATRFSTSTGRSRTGTRNRMRTGTGTSDIRSIPASSIYAIQDKIKSLNSNLDVKKSQSFAPPDFDDDDIDNEEEEQEGEERHTTFLDSPPKSNQRSTNRNRKERRSKRVSSTHSRHSRSQSENHHHGHSHCRKDAIPLTDEEREHYKQFIDGEAERTEQRTNIKMKKLMNRALVPLEPNAAETVFHDIFYDTMVRNHPVLKTKKKPRAERALEKYRKLRKKKKHKADCRKCAKHPSRCILPTIDPMAKYKERMRKKKQKEMERERKDPNSTQNPNQDKDQNDQSDLTSAQKREICRTKFGIPPEISGDPLALENWNSKWNPLDVFLTDTEGEEEEQDLHGYLDCLKAIDVSQEVEGQSKGHRSSLKGQGQGQNQSISKSGDLPKERGDEGAEEENEKVKHGQGQGQDISDPSSLRSSKGENDLIESMKPRRGTMESEIASGVSDSRRQTMLTESSRAGSTFIDIGDGLMNNEAEEDNDNEDDRNRDLDVDIDLDLDPNTEAHTQMLELEFDDDGDLIPLTGIPRKKFMAISKLLADPNKSRFLRKLIGVKNQGTQKDYDDEKKMSIGSTDNNNNQNSEKENQAKVNTSEKPGGTGSSRKRAIQKKRLHLVKRALEGNYGKHVRKALREKNVHELLFLIQLDRNQREEYGFGSDEEEDASRKSQSGERRKKRHFKKKFNTSSLTDINDPNDPNNNNNNNQLIHSMGMGELRREWRERWYGSKYQQGQGHFDQYQDDDDYEDIDVDNDTENRDPNNNSAEGSNKKKRHRGWRLVRDTGSRLCLIKHWRDSRTGEWNSRKIRLNKDNKPESLEEKKHRLLKKMERRLEREKRIQELQHVFGTKVPRVAYERYDREQQKKGKDFNNNDYSEEDQGQGQDKGQRSSQSKEKGKDGQNIQQLKARFLCTPSKKEDDEDEEQCFKPKYRVSSDESNSSSEEEENFRVIVTDPYPYNNSMSMKNRMNTASSNNRPTSGLADTIGIPEHSESYKLGSIRMLTSNYNIGRMVSMDMPWVGPELFGISADQYHSEQLKAAYREVLRVICLNDRALKWISQEMKPEVTQAVKIFYAQIQILQGLMYARLLMSPQEEITRIQYLKQTWIREQRLLGLLKTLEGELVKLEKEREEMMQTLNESINNYIGQIDHAYLQCHQDIVKTIAEYTKMELVTTKSADHALQELHGTLQKCITVASIMRAKYAEYEDKLQKQKFKLLADLEALVSQYDTELFARQETFDNLLQDEEVNTEELNRLDNELRKVEYRFNLMMEERQAKQQSTRRKKKGKSKGKKGKKGKKKRSKKGKKGGSKKGKRGKKGGKKGKKGKRGKGKKGGASSGEETSEYEDGSEFEDEGETSGTEGTTKQVKIKMPDSGKNQSKSKAKSKSKSKSRSTSKSRSKSKSKSPGRNKKKRDSRNLSVDLGSDAELKMKKQKGKSKQGTRASTSAAAVKAFNAEHKEGDIETEEGDEGLEETGGVQNSGQKSKEKSKGKSKSKSKSMSKSKLKASKSKPKSAKPTEGGKKGKGKKSGAKRSKSRESQAQSQTQSQPQNTKSKPVSGKTSPKTSKSKSMTNDEDFDEPPSPKPEDEHEQKDKDDDAAAGEKIEVESGGGGTGTAPSSKAGGGEATEEEPGKRAKTKEKGDKKKKKKSKSKTKGKKKKRSKSKTRTKKKSKEKKK